MERFGNIVTADVLFQQLFSSLKVISTGCSNLDEILGGGLITGEVTEIFGSPGVGKTQACLSIASHVAGTIGKNVVYIDTVGGFSAARIHEILTEKCVADGNIMNHMARIQCIGTFEIYHTLFILDKLAKQLSLKEDGFYEDVVVVIFDNVASIVSPILGTHRSPGHGMMVRFLQALKSLAYDNSVAVLLTNNAVMDSHNNLFTKPALGLTWARMPQNRIFLRRSEQDPSQRFIEATRLSRMPEEEGLPVTISESGLH